MIVLLESSDRGVRMPLATSIPAERKSSSSFQLDEDVETLGLI